MWNSAAARDRPRGRAPATILLATALAACVAASAGCGDAKPGSGPVAPAGDRLSGRVEDENGRALAGVTVTAHDDALHKSVSVFTDASGRYSFPELAAGEYRVRARSGK